GTLPARVEGDQLACELVRPGPRTRLDAVPGLPAELRERGRVPVGADVARNLPDLLVRDIEAVVALEPEEEVVARDARDGLRLETEQLADAVGLVDHVVTGAQIGEALEGTSDSRVGAWRALAEDLRVREEDEPEVAQDESAPRGRDGEEEPFPGGQLVAGLENDGLDAAKERLG